MEVITITLINSRSKGITVPVPVIFAVVAMNGSEPVGFVGPLKVLVGTLVGCSMLVVGPAVAKKKFFFYHLY